MITPSFSLTATERVLPKLALDFTTASLDPRVTFTRTTDATHPATYVNSSGYIVSATNNQARFDYDPVALTCKGLLIEESRTNLMINSNAFSSWTDYAVSISSDSTIDPGNGTAQKLVEDTSFGFHRVYSSATTTATATTASFYIKPNNRNFAFVRLKDSGGTTRNAFFNISTGTVGVLEAGYTATITPAKNGFYRCTATITTFAGANVMVIGLSDTDGVDVYTGNGTSGAYLYGAQLEAGAFVTSYIPTTSASLTRNADVATMTGTNFSSWYNQAASSFEFQFIGKSPSGTIVGIDAGQDPDSGNNYINTVFTPGPTAQPTVKYAGTTQAYDQVAIVANASNKVSFGVTTNSFIAAANATLGTLDTSVTVPSTPNQLRFGNSYNTGQGSMWFQKLNYWPQRLTNSEIQAFSK